MPSIRLLVLCVFRHGSRILVARGFDSVKSERFLRPLGGEIEFGETSVDALRREIREELGEEIADPVLLGVLENRFTYEGEPRHEVVFVYDAAFPDRALYARSELELDEAVWQGAARWIDLSDPPSEALYPEGLLGLLGRDG